MRTYNNVFQKLYFNSPIGFFLTSISMFYNINILITYKLNLYFRVIIKLLKLL